jgi:uncharacterized membrane protein
MFSRVREPDFSLFELNSERITTNAGGQIMNRLIDILCWVVGIAALIVAIWQFILFVKFPGVDSGTKHLWIAIISAVVTCVCALWYFLRHVNKEEEIHITQ